MASLMKVACNALTGITLQSMGETLALLSKAGIDRRRAFEILTGTLFDGRVHKAYGGKMVDERYQIGRESCREGVCQYVQVAVIAGTLKTKQIQGQTDVLSITTD